MLFCVAHNVKIWLKTCNNEGGEEYSILSVVPIFYEYGTLKEDHMLKHKL